MNKSELVIGQIVDRQAREIAERDPDDLLDTRTNRTCLSYWFPKLCDAGLPVPKTEIVRITSGRVQQDLFRVFDGHEPTIVSAPFFREMRATVEKLGVPCFLRTGQGSGKHLWKDTCYVTDVERMPQHIYALIEWSETVDMIGLPWDVWAVRELLPTVPQMTAPRYGNMPVCREFRFFVDDGTIRCWHPYWPKQALIDGFNYTSAGELLGGTNVPLLPPNFDHRYDCLCYMPGVDTPVLNDLASSAGRAVGGSWSIDILETKRGWYVTDMAEADRSWHWPECPSHVSLTRLDEKVRQG